MKLKYAHLADYAGADASGKVTIVGIFDRIYDALKGRPIPFPQFHIVAVFEARVTEGTDHKVQLQFIDQKKRAILQKFDGTIRFGPTGRGLPLHAPLLLGFGPGAISVPDLGGYEFRFMIDGKDIGGLPVTVTEPPSAPE